MNGHSDMDIARQNRDKEFEGEVRNCVWDIRNDFPPHNPKTKDFIEADVELIVRALQSQEASGYKRGLQECLDIVRNMNCTPNSGFARASKDIATAIEKKLKEIG